MRLILSTLLCCTLAHAQDALPPFAYEDVFELEWVGDPQLSPDGTTVVFIRNQMDKRSDSRVQAIWQIDIDGKGLRPLTDQEGQSMPRYSPAGDKLAFLSSATGKPSIHVLYLDTGVQMHLADLPKAPSALAWSPDGEQLAFTMIVASEKEPLTKMPKAPEGANWASPPKVIDQIVFRTDGGGFVEPGFRHVFVLPVEGGTPRQLSSGDFHHDGPLAWHPDGKRIFFSADRSPDWELDPLDGEIFSVNVQTGALSQHTDRDGPDVAPSISPNGAHLAYLGFDDRKLGFQTEQLHVIELPDGKPQVLAADLDRSVRDVRWQDDATLTFLYDDKGDTKLATVSLDDERNVLAQGIGGQALGRPYASGDYTMGTGRLVYTTTTPSRPADLVARKLDGSERTVLTAFNDDLLARRSLGEIREYWFESSHDRREIQAWVVTPPSFDPEQRYPLILEIHGGPFANYGPRFAAEMQLYAAAGYVVVYANPRGSTSYGAEFANLIHHNYPGEDHDDLMSVVDGVINLGFVDAQRLYITGGSGGGVLTAWAVGHTDRFRAAAVQKPVINWTSFVLTADFANFFSRYWFGAFPWEDPDAYFKRSPLSYVGNVSTPTMLITGEEDYRTPIAQSEEFYQALKLRGVDTVLVRIPEASHLIARRPSQLIAKVAHVLAWFEKY